MASTRLSFLLDGRDGLSRVLDRAGDNAVRLQRRFSAVTTNTTAAFNRLTGAADRNGRQITAAMRASQTATARFTTDANGRLRDLRGRYLSASQAMRLLQGDTSGLPDRMDDVAASTSRAASAGGSLSPVLMGVAAAAGLSLLPALGALVPMMAGAGLVAGTMSLGFNGVGEAAALAGKDQEKYREALKKMSPESRGFTKELVSLKKEFGGLGKDIQKVMLPGFTRALKDARPVVDILGQGMVKLGKGFGEAAAGAGRLFKSGGFQADLRTNLDLGMSFVRELGGGFSSLLRGLLDFGSKSKPTLDAFSSGLSGLLGKGGGGLVGMFRGLETGIGGSAKMLDGLFGMLNRVLPAVGRFAGEVARTFGPMLGELFESTGQRTSAALDILGQGVRALAPVFKDLGYGIKTSTQLLAIIGPTMRDVGSAIVGALLPASSEVEKFRGPFERLSGAIQNNKGAIQEAARVMGGLIIDMVSAGVEHLPTLIGLFRTMSSGVVTALGGILHGAASAFGWIPGIGDKLRSADESFSSFQQSFIGGLATAEAKTREFAAGALPKLQQGKLKVDISNWNSQLETAKAKLKTVPPEKRASLKAHITDLQNKVAQARRELASLQNRSVTVTTRYVTVGDSSAARKSGSHGSTLKYASGGLVGYPSGGMVTGPGTGTSDSILARVSNGEFVIRAKSVARYGARFLAAINEGRLGMASTVSGAGGSMAGAGAEAGRGLQAGLRAAAAGVDGAARTMASAVEAGIRAELQIASPSKKTKALAADVGKGFIAGLTGSKAKIAAVAKDLVKDIVAAWKGVNTNKDSRLVAMVNRDTKKLQKLASERDAIAARIKAAKDFAKTITAGARQDAALGSLGIEQEDVSAGSIKGALSEKLAKLKTFTSYIKTLAKRGLNKSLLRQVLEMGPEQGYAYASALAGADASTFKAINSLESQINHGADALGLAGADGMYDAGANAGKGFLTGLASQQKAIEKQMLTIAKAMEKAIKKALGIKSPSRVMAGLGRYTTEGLAVGMTERLPVLDAALGAVTDRVASTRPVIGRPAVVGAGAGGAVYHIKIEVRDAMDPVAVGRELERVMTRFQRGQGR
ncbi:hypothetical protein [Streptomyces sp. NPDC001741]|uniref:hypothetical protein n=1 Tax=Streptomyces sp. NPDC001741 TaxID=3364605 RepID=UPI0036AC7BCA